MTNWEATFLEEAAELLVILEQELLTLEKDQKNKESISAVFRAMHTLKGSASMFGFNSVHSATHHLETIYESVRDGYRPLTNEILNITLNSLDHLKKLLHDPKPKDATLLEAHQILLKEIEHLTNYTESTDNSNSLPIEEDTKEITYYIAFNPLPQILKNGTNTLYIIDDLVSLGNTVCLPFFNNLPAFNAIEPPLSYTGFELVVCTNKSENYIREIFLFVEGSCELTIEVLEDGNLIENNDARQLLTNNQTLFTRLGKEKIKSILLQALPPTTPEADLSRRGKNVSNVRVSSERLDELLNLVSELVTTQASLSLWAEQTESPHLVSIAENVEKITRRLRDNAFMMSLIPIESLVIRFQRLVRDLSAELKKDVVVKTEGTETEIDKSIIEKIADPLLHLLRNSLDHGIEDPAERERKGKPRQGTLTLRAYYSGANVIIEISDDGAGINLKKVRQKAISKGLISAEAELSDQAAIDLIFSPGFSTAEQVTNVSGRGVGMDVVRRNISDLRGDIHVTTQENKGTKFTIRLPLTLSIIDGLLVRIGDTDFILPFSSVYKCYEIETTALEETHNQWVTLDGFRTPFVFLRKTFNILQSAPLLSHIIKISHEGNDVGIVVDRIIGEYQAVLKPLGPLYTDYDEFSGSTILGDGSVALVMDPYKLIKKLATNQHLN